MKKILLPALLLLVVSVLLQACGGSERKGEVPFAELTVTGQPFIVDQDTVFHTNEVIPGPAIGVSSFTWSVTAAVGAPITVHAENNTLTFHPHSNGCYSVGATVLMKDGEALAAEPISGCT
jgi:hypothetical protein